MDVGYTSLRQRSLETGTGDTMTYRHSATRSLSARHGRVTMNKSYEAPLKARTQHFGL